MDLLGARRASASLVALLALCAVAVAAVWPGTALADDNAVPVSSVNVQRLDATVTKTTIVTAYATAHDSVEVYNYVPVTVSSDWRQATSMDDATWVFKPGGGAPKLAIFFTVEGGKHVARLYDDQLGQGAAPVTIKDDHVVLGRPSHWTLQAESAQPWILPDGRPATDLQVESAFSLPHEDEALGVLAHRWHGQDAWDFRMVDPTGSGVPEYTILQLHPQAAPSAAVPRTLIDNNVAAYHVTAFRPAIFWPYLGTADVGVRSWFDQRPPLSMDWKAGQLRDFGSLLPDLEPENGMQVYSNTPVVADQPNALDFENPFAYYRFDPGHTGFPNLIVRNYSFPSGDEFLQPGGPPQPVQFVRYSWGNGDGLLQYKLGLLGRHQLAATLALGDASIRTMDYAGLPAWVAGHLWDFETFVASETGGYRSSEGIYDWDDVSGDFAWVLGDSSTLPLDGYRAITPGLRGEYRTLPDASPQLYLDPTDQRLHLLGAQQGVWAVDQHQTITTASLNGQTVDQWTRNVDNAPQEAFYALPQTFLYAGNDTVVLQPHPAPPPVTALSPPTDEASLNALRRLLPADPPPLATGGLRSMLDPSGRQQVTITGVTVTHARLLPDGWRAELQATGAVTIAAAPDAPAALLRAVESGLGCLQAPSGPTQPLTCSRGQGEGRYVLEYDGVWRLLPATPPDLRVLAVQAGNGPSGLAETPVTVTVANAGATDSSDRRLEIWAQRAGHERIAIADLALDVPAGEQRQLSLRWVPSGPGDWSVGAALAPPGSSSVASASATSAPVVATVAVPSGPPPAWWALGPASSRRLVGAALAVLAALSVFTAVIVGAILR
jgi:hypothetical protein